jgi:hypothetical protein
MGADQSEATGWFGRGRGRRPAGRTASRQASPKTLEAVPNASFEGQTVYLFLKIILDPKEFVFWSERSQGLSKELKLHCRYRCASSAGPARR